jgi:hypothetical protein
MAWDGKHFFMCFFSHLDFFYEVLIKWIQKEYNTIQIKWDLILSRSLVSLGNESLSEYFKQFEYIQKIYFPL